MYDVCMKRYGTSRIRAPALAWGEADGVDCQRLRVVTGECPYVTKPIYRSNFRGTGGARSRPNLSSSNYSRKRPTEYCNLYLYVSVTCKSKC